MRGMVIGKILASKAPSFSPGNYVTCTPGWTELSILDSKEVTLLEVPSNGRVTDALGVLGATGLTAYFGMTDIGQVKAGDFVVVSGAAGATGSVACQIAKLKGARVLGLAGSDEKVTWLKELGCDDALNYKDPEFTQKFKEATKDLIDVFFDNVGGEILEAALSRAKAHARFVMCGAISQYNIAQPKGPKVGYLLCFRTPANADGFTEYLNGDCHAHQVSSPSEPPPLNVSAETDNYQDARLHRL